MPKTLQDYGVLPFSIAALQPGAGGVVSWPLSEELAATPAVAWGNRFAVALSGKCAEEIARSYVYMSLAQMRRLVKLALKHAARRRLAGYGIELGTGCGLLSAVAAEQRQVRRTLALEVCDKMAELVIPKVSAWVLGGAASFGLHAPFARVTRPAPPPCGWSSPGVIWPTSRPGQNSWPRGAGLFSCSRDLDSSQRFADAWPCPPALTHPPLPNALTHYRRRRLYRLAFDRAPAPGRP